MPDRDVRPITLADMQREFIDTNARLDRTIGLPNALDRFVEQENPRREFEDSEKDDDGDDEQTENVGGQAG